MPYDTFHHLLAVGQGPQVDKLAIFGFFAAVGTLCCWYVARGTRRFRIAAGVLQLCLAAYGFLAGAWPLGIVFVAAGVASIFRSRRVRCTARKAEWYLAPHYPEVVSARMHRLFGDVKPATGPGRHNPGQDRHDN